MKNTNTKTARKSTRKAARKATPAAPAVTADTTTATMNAYNLPESVTNDRRVRRAQVGGVQWAWGGTYRHRLTLRAAGYQWHSEKEAWRRKADSMPTAAAASRRAPLHTLGAYEGQTRRLAYEVANMGLEAVEEAARRLAPMVQAGSIILPMPSPSGRATYTLEIARRLAAAVEGATVADVLEGDAARMTLHAEIPNERPVYILANVIDNGAAERAALAALAGDGTTAAEVLAVAYTPATPDQLRPEMEARERWIAAKRAERAAAKAAKEAEKAAEPAEAAAQEATAAA